MTSVPVQPYSSFGPAPYVNPAAAGTALLDALLAQLRTTPGWDDPGRIGPVPGSLTAYDGEQLTVNLTQITRGLPGQEMTRATTPYDTALFYTFDVVLLRTVVPESGALPPGGFPDPDQLAGDYATIAADTGAMLFAVQTVQNESTIVPPNVPFAWQLLQVGPEGALAGNRLTVSFMAGQSTDPNQVY